LVALVCLIGTGMPAASQRLENGRPRPMVDGDIQARDVVVRNGSARPGVAAEFVEGAASANYIRLQIERIAGAVGQDYTLVIRDSNRSEIVRYTRPELDSKPLFWTPPIFGAAAWVEIEPKGGDRTDVSFVVRKVASQHTPADPLLSIIGENGLERIEWF